VSGTTRLRPRPTRKIDELARRALPTLILPVCVISLAAILSTMLSPRGGLPDLFELTPKTSRVDGYVVVRWAELERGYRSLKHGATLYLGAPALALGYMAEDGAYGRGGEPAGRFLLTPEMGIAQRFGDREIEVRLQEGTSVSLLPGALVWVWGTWHPLTGNPNREKALYVMEDARVEAAERGDIAKYFR
jgi:hypothetical protein